MRIGFVGAGKVGFTLGKYMSERNVCVSGYYSRSEESARQASVFTHTKYYETLEDLIGSSDALFLTVPDGAIEDVWNSIKRYSLTGKFICHCSGVMTSAVFSEINQMGAFGYSIHPLFAIHSRSQSYQEISQAYFTIEGPEAHIGFWKDFFENLGNPVRIIRAEQKALYHGAAVFVSNLVTARRRDHPYRRQSAISYKPAICRAGTSGAQAVISPQLSVGSPRRDGGRSDRTGGAGG